MGYVSENLMPGERVVFETKIHPIIFLWPAIILALGLLVLEGGAAGVAILIAISWAASAFVRRSTSEFAVTDRRLIVKVGVISRRTLEMQLTKIESLGIDQSILGRILGYGTVRCRGVGAGDQQFRSVANAMAVRRHVYELAEQLSQRERVTT